MATPANLSAEIEAAEGQVAVSKLGQKSTQRCFDALAASAMRTSAALDRHWRNTRTIGQS